MATGVTTAREEWQRHWTLVLSAAIGFSFISLMTPAAGVFMGPLSEEFGWSRTQLSLGIGIAGLLGVIGSPLFGALLDRCGARRLALPGLVIAAITTSSFSLANGSVTQWVFLWFLWGLSALLILSTTWSAAVASVFVTGRGLALGLTLSGTALAHVIVPPLTNWLIEAQGWRAAFVWLGIGWGGLAFILSFFFFYDARDRHRLGGGGQQRLSEARALMPGLSLAAAWRDWALWRVAISTFLILAITVAISVHQFPLLVEAGVSRDQAAWLVSLTGAAGIVGKLVTGSLLDRYHARWTGGITLASTAIAYPLLLGPVHNVLPVVIGIMISGYAAGTKIQLCGYLAARYGGMRNYGAIFGAMTSLIALAGATGPIAAGASFDYFGTYNPLLIFGAVISIISALLVFSLGAYPDWARE